MNFEFTDVIDKAVAGAWDRVSAEIERLTNEQFVEAITQAIRCGDFMRLVHIAGNSQAVTYEPFRKVRELEARISELEAEVDDLRASCGGYA
jgi:hypothetical protein